MPNLYAIRKIPPSASQSEVKAAYKRQALASHPDKGGSSLAFQQVVAAFEQLADPLLRRAYDQRCASRSVRPRVKVTKDTKAKQSKSNEVTKGQTRGAMKQPGKAAAAKAAQAAKCDGDRSFGAARSKNRVTWKHRLLANVVKLLKALPADRRTIFASRLLHSAWS